MLFNICLSFFQMWHAGGREYWMNTWNLFDWLGLYLYIIGFIMRMVYHNDPTTCPDCLYLARITMAFSLMIFICRMLEFLLTNNAIGPKISMIRRLLVSRMQIVWASQATRFVIIQKHTIQDLVCKRLLR